MTTTTPATQLADAYRAGYYAALEDCRDLVADRLARDPSTPSKP